MGGLGFNVLGPLEVVRDGEPLELGPARQRALLAVLLIHRGQVLSTDRLLDELWGDTPPTSAGHALQVYVSNLRKVLEPERPRGSPGATLVTRRPGYVLDVPAESVDAHRFEELAAEGRSLVSTDAAAASHVLRQALDLWRGPALADFAYEPFAEAEAGRLEELRSTALEDRAEADLAMGRHADLVGELESLVARHPLRERLWGQLIVALYRSDRQADALATYERVRTLLSEELGIDPSPRLQQLHHAVLNQDLGADPQSETPDAPPSASVRPDESKAPPMREERRFVTALVADLVASSALAEMLDVEDYKIVIDDAVDRMVAAVEAFGGTIIGRPGDGVVALFGAPEAAEDDSDRAVQAGLRLCGDVAEYGREVAQSWAVEPLAARVAVDCGLVVVGPTAMGDATTYAAVGDPLNTAAHLQSAATPGTVLVTEAVRTSVAPLFDTADTQEFGLRGKDRTVLATQVLARHPVSGRVRGIEGVDAVLVGRELELAASADSLRSVLSGSGGVLVLSGEPGIGKTRLLSELRAVATEAGARWLEGRCASYAQSRAYWPFAELIRDWAGVASNEPDLRSGVSLRRQVKTLFGERGADVYPFLAAVLGLRTETGPGRLPVSSPEGLQQGMVEGIRRTLERLATDRPLIAVFEDLHWADPSSLHVLEHLFPATDRCALLLVLVMRPERDHPAWGLREAADRRVGHRLRTVALEPLAEDASRGLLHALVGADALPADVQKPILTAAEGNPFFLEEIVRGFADAGALVRSEQGWRFVGDIAVEIPHSVEKVILSRVDRLPAECRDVLEAASVLGRRFTLSSLAATSGTDPGDVLPTLLRAGLLSEAQRWPHPEFQFKHALGQEAVYRTLVPARRRSLHRRAAEAIEASASGSGPDAYGTLARHWAEAGEPVRALGYHKLAGDEAAGVYALDEALEHYTEGIDLAGAAGDDAPPSTVLELLLGRADVFFLLGDDRAETDGRAALDLARRLGDQDAEWRALEGLGYVEMYRHGRRRRGAELLQQALDVARNVSNMAGEVHLLSRLSIERATRLDFEDALEDGKQALAVAQRAGEDALTARALDCLKLVAFYLGDWDELERMSSRLDGILREQDGFWYLQFALAESAFGLWATGRVDEAFGRLAAAEDVRGRLPRTSEEAFFLSMRAWMDRGRGQYGRAADLARSAAAIDVNPQWTVWGQACAGVVLLEIGALEEAVAYLELARSGAEQQGILVQSLRCGGHLARALHELGDHVGADTALEGMRRTAEAVRTPDGTAFLFGADAYIAAADVLAQRNQADAARDMLGPVLEAAESAGYLEAIADGSMILARCSDNDTIGLLVRASEAASAGSLPRAMWQCHAALARAHSRGGRIDDAAEHRRYAEEIVAKLASSLEGTEWRAGYVDRCRASIMASD